jgi:hypothetical protein
MGSETYVPCDSPQTEMVDFTTISVGRPAVVVCRCVTNHLIRIDNLPLKHCQFCCLGVIMQYAMAASENRHQHLDDDGVGSPFEFRGYR